MTLFLDNDDVHAVLSMRRTIDALEDAYLQLAEGEAVCRVHTNLQVPTDDPTESYQWGTTDGGNAGKYLAIRMTSDVRYETEVSGVRRQDKYCVSKGTYCGLVFLFQVNNGEPLAIFNDGYMQQQRVGADAAIGVRYMARNDAEVIGMFGAGGMARSHVEAIREVRNIKKVHVYDPAPANMNDYAEEMRKRFDLEVVVVDDPRDVYRGADILTECTNALGTPVINGEFLEKGTHIVSIGRRLDMAAHKKIDISLRLGNATSPSGHPEVTDEHLNYVTPRMKRGLKSGSHPSGYDLEIAKNKVVTLAEIIKGKPGRTSNKEITYSERGNIMGAQFHALAGIVYEIAKEKNMGKVIPTEWFLQKIRN